MADAGQSSIAVRRFEQDDAEALTDLLHRAYAELGAMGLNYTAVDQSVAETLPTPQPVVVLRLEGGDQVGHVVGGDRLQQREPVLLELRVVFAQQHHRQREQISHNGYASPNRSRTVAA